MTTTAIRKTINRACAWRGIYIAGIKASGPCTREATLTGCNNGSGEQHLCTQHMRQRNLAGHGYTYVWPCQANGFVRYAATARALGHNTRALSADAARLCR